LKRKELPRSKVRGKDRLLKAAIKSSSHIRFDQPMDDDNEGDKNTKVAESSNEPESTV